MSTETLLHVPHIDDVDPATDAYTAAGVTHLDFKCRKLDDRSSDTIKITPIADANGWLCEVCIDACPRIGILGKHGIELRSTGEGGGTGSGSRKTAKPASDKAMAYLRSLADATDTDLDALADPDGGFSARTVSGLIDILKKEAAEAAPEAGFYTNPAGVTVEVKISKTGNWYGMIDGEYVGRKVGGKLTKAEAPAPVAASAGLDLSKIPSGRYAVPGGDTRLKVRIKNPTEGNWAGFTFVNDAAVYGNGTRYGMAKPGEAYKGKIEAELAIIAADPKAAAAAYGKLVGKCGRCNRTLEDADSVKRGLGPTCMNKSW